MCINHIVAAESLVTEGSPTQLQSMSWAATVIHCKLVIWVAEGFASPNIPIVTGDSLGSSAFVDTKAYGKQENLFQTSNNFCIILLSSLLYYMLLVEKQYMAWKGRFDSKAARKLHLQKCRLLLVRQHQMKLLRHLGFAKLQHSSINPSSNQPMEIHQSRGWMPKCQRWVLCKRKLSLNETFSFLVVQMFLISYIWAIPFVLCKLWPNRLGFRRKALMCHHIWKWLTLFPGFFTVMSW